MAPSLPSAITLLSNSSGVWQRLLANELIQICEIDRYLSTRTLPLMRVLVDKLFHPEPKDDINHTTVNQILALFDNDSSKIERLFETFYLNCERAAEDANTALAQHDQDSLRQIAHSIKSAALNIGASKIASLAEQMEHGAEDSVRHALLTAITAENQRFSAYARTRYVTPL